MGKLDKTMIKRIMSALEDLSQAVTPCGALICGMVKISTK